MGDTLANISAHLELSDFTPENLFRNLKLGAEALCLLELHVELLEIFVLLQCPLPTLAQIIPPGVFLLRGVWVEASEPIWVEGLCWWVTASELSDEVLKHRLLTHTLLL